jgi:hypothetical protein
MKTIFISIILLLITNLCFSADVVQISTSRDSLGHWQNWIIQIVIWDLTILTDVPDHNSISTRALQTWFFPVETGFITATFVRPLGIYALRWSRDGVIFSGDNMVEVKRPDKPNSK